MFRLLWEKARNIGISLWIFNFFSLFFVGIPTLLLIINSFKYGESGVLDNGAFVNKDLIAGIIRSFWVSIFSVFLVFLLGYPSAFLLSKVNNKIYRSLLIALIICPLWSSFFVKLIGLKSFFDWIYGSANSTYGLIYVVIGLIYINLPLAIINFYNGLRCLPSNLVFASLDLGHSNWESIWRIIIPYTKDSIFSTIFLIFLSSFASVTIADFMNKESSSLMIGQLINNYAGSDLSNLTSLKRISVVTLFLSFVMIIFYLIFRSIVTAKPKKNG